MRKSDKILYCPSCGRSNYCQDRIEPISYNKIEWCTYCAAIKTINGRKHVLLPSPGRMIESAKGDPLVAWEDCYFKTPKKRILKQTAKDEIQRAWMKWDGDKSSQLSMFEFFLWLTRFRPYFLTFRGIGDSWQTIHSWLIQSERAE